MAVMLPNVPPAKQGWKPLSASNVLSPAFGGDELELQRKGARYEFSYDYGEMDYAEALAWSDLEVQGQTVVAPIYQPGLDTGEPGSPVVDGSAQIGRVLKLRGLTPGYVIRKGQFLSVFDSGQQRFVYRADAQVVANAEGKAEVSLYFLLRAPHANGSVVEIKEPKVEGYPREVSEMEVYDNHNVTLTFKVRERR